MEGARQSPGGSLEVMLEGFENKISRVENGIKFLDVLYFSVEGKYSLREMKDDISELSTMCEVIREKIKTERSRLEEMKKQRERLHGVQARLNHIHFNMPEAALPQVAVAQAPAIQQVEPEQPEEPPAKLQNKENVKPKKGIACINMLLESDLHRIPKHVKSHLTLDQVNGGIKEVNHILEKKYEFLRRPRSTLNRSDEKKRSVYLEMGKDLKGTCYEIFFTDSDIKDYTRVLKTKMKTKESVFLILRHLGKMKEVRKGKVPRYCILAG